jgi:ribonucleoside-diphosphate reductase alpha chain
MSFKISDNARIVLEQRYLIKNERGEIVETPEQMFHRVAKAVAGIEKYYKMKDEEVKALEEQFYNMMINFEFLPNSPTLMNAGTGMGQLSACFVLPIEDNIDSIMDGVKNAVKIHKSGGGTGFNFGHLRPRGDIVQTTSGVSSGPISFMTVFDRATEVIKQGGKRRGANIGILNVTHPDIMDFITMKEREGFLSNFNISVAVTNKFMDSVVDDKEFNLVNPRGNKIVRTLKARTIWNLLVYMSWKNGEPAIIFIDRINKFNPTPEVGLIESTNPCGEQPLLPYESCNLGSINLSKFVENGEISWKRLEQNVKLATRFLDNIIDCNIFPLDEISQMTHANRKIGLGIMGFADMLILLGIKYGSDESYDKAQQIMKFITNTARLESLELGREKEDFLNFKKSIFHGKYPHMRNATVTTIAPTGTISILAECSSGIEPIFSPVIIKSLEESLGATLVEINQCLKNLLESKGLWNESIQTKLKTMPFKDIEEIPKSIKDLFVTAHDLLPQQHVEMQAAFQKYTDNAVSKTVNFPRIATPDDVEEVFLEAYKLGCKGVTVYRDGSRQVQVLYKPTPKKTELEDIQAFKKSCTESGICQVCD